VDREKDRARRVAWKLANPEKFADGKRAWAKANREKCRASIRAWTERQPGGGAGVSRRWQAANPGKQPVYAARRRATRLQAMPVWANEFFIAEAYHLAKLRTKATGLEWHVDHIVPLQSKKVCGLHVEFNLQVIPAKVNASKSNRYWPDMPTEIHT
jgi:hypothetical protein